MTIRDDDNPTVDGMPTDDEMSEAFCNGVSYLSLIIHRGNVKDWSFAGGKEEVEKAKYQIDRTWKAWAKSRGRKLYS